MSCCVRRRCDGMGPDAVDCWSLELEDAGRASCLRLYASWRRLSCGRTRVPELASRVRAGGSGGMAAYVVVMWWLHRPGTSKGARTSREHVQACAACRGGARLHSVGCWIRVSHVHAPAAASAGLGFSRIHYLVLTDVLRRQVHASQADCAPSSEIQPERCWHDVGGDAWFCERCGQAWVPDGGSPAWPDL